MTGTANAGPMHRRKQQGMRRAARQADTGDLAASRALTGDLLASNAPRRRRVRHCFECA
jgi:hypothetical protein